MRKAKKKASGADLIRWSSVRKIARGFLRKRRDKKD
jgi:hypothetical protein